MTGVDEWRSTILALLQGYTEPVNVLLVLLAFSLGLFSVRALG